MRRLLCACLLTLFVLAQTGCWSRRELTEVSFAGLLGIDWADDQYLVTVNILSSRQPSGGGMGKGSAVWTVSQAGPALDDALARIDHILTRALTLAHVRAIIFGAEMARHGIGPAIDFLTRSVELRPTAWVGITNGTARDLLSARVRQESSASLGPLGYHDATLDRSSVIAAQRLVQVAYDLQEEGIQLSLPLFRLGDTEPPKAGEDKSPAGENAREVIFGGGGFFREDKLVGWLTPEEVQGQLFIAGRIVHGAISAPCPTSGGRVVFRLRKEKSSIQVSQIQGRLTGTIRINEIADLNELGCPEGLLAEGNTAKLEQVMAAQVEAQVRHTLAMVRETGSDFVGLGQHLFRHNPGLFRQYEKRWPQELASMPITVQVKATILRLGQLNRRFKWNGISGVKPWPGRAR